MILQIDIIPPWPPPRRSIQLNSTPQGRTSDNSWQTIISCNSLEFIHQSQSQKNPWERFSKIWTQNWNSRLNLAVVCWLIILNETEKRRRQSTLLFFTMILKLLDKIRLQKTILRNRKIKCNNFFLQIHISIFSLSFSFNWVNSIFRAGRMKDIGLVARSWKWHQHQEISKIIAQCNFSRRKFGKYLSHLSLLTWFS